MLKYFLTIAVARSLIFLFIWSFLLSKWANMEADPNVVRAEMSSQIFRRAAAAIRKLPTPEEDRRSNPEIKILFLKKEFDYVAD